MSWNYKTHKIGDITQFPENTFGFIYKVTHKPTGKSYIGKKVLFHNKKQKIGKTTMVPKKKSNNYYLKVRKMSLKEKY